MIFISDKRNTKVWNPSTKKVLCEFDNFKFKTDNVNLIRKLNDLGYACEEGQEKVLEILDTKKDMNPKEVVPEIQKEVKTEKKGKRNIKTLSQDEADHVLSGGK